MSCKNCSIMIELLNETKEKLSEIDNDIEAVDADMRKTQKAMFYEKACEIYKNKLKEDK